MDKYVELTNDVSQRAILVPADSWSQERDFTTNEWYRSVYQFDNEIDQWIKDYGGIKGFDGKIYPDLIPLDIDPGKSECKLIDMLRTTLLELDDMEIPEDWYTIYFSGRGFHIMLPYQLFGFTPGNDLNMIVKNTMTNLFDGIDGNIYNKTRLFRVPNSINNKTGLYKIPLTQSEARHLSIEKIQELARNPRLNSVAEIPFEDIDPILSTKVIRQILAINQTIRIPDTPKRHNCIIKMLETPPTSGERHNLCMRVASHFRRNCYPESMTRAVLKNWVGNQKDFTNNELEKVITDIYNGNYVFGCNDFIMASYCDSRCAMFSNKVAIKSDKMSKMLYDRLTSDLPVFGLEWIPLNYRAYPGDVVQIVGDAGIGKSALAQNWVLHQKVPVLYCSFEMSPALLYRRWMQIAYNLNKNEAAQKVIENPTFGSHRLDHVRVITETLTIDQLEAVIDGLDNDPLVVVIDHILLMGSQYIDEYKKVADITGKMKQLAIKKNKIFLAISQISKSDAKEGRLTMHSSKGNASIYQDADTVIMVQRKNPNSDRMRLFTSKEREGQFFDEDVYYHGDTFRVNRMMGIIQ